jgi:methylthioribose-1-phosphate isomerase
LIPKTLEWKNDALYLLDQTRLPLEEVELRCGTVAEVVSAIKCLAVRGAPAIGVAGAYGVAIAALNDPASVVSAIKDLAASRPTAVNLFWALEKMTLLHRAGATPAELLVAAQEIEADDRERCRLIGEHGAALLPDEATVITHCNAGALATAGIGTALAVIYRAVELGKRIKVYADETRPLLQGARITAWELQRSGVDVTLITDGMAAAVMKRRRVDAVITGADRIAANGDAANKIGTYGLAVAARHHGIPFYIAAPFSTFDAKTAHGEAIPIEERDPSEVTEGFGRRTAPPGIAVFNPAFDVTPADLIRSFITERGVFPATREALAKAMAER